MFISIFQQQHQITIQRRTDDEVVIVYVWVCSDFTENYVHLYTTRECSMRFSTFYFIRVEFVCEERNSTKNYKCQNSFKDKKYK